MNKLRTITVPAGIGDFIWLAMKLVNQKEKFHIKLPDGTPQRGHQILELLPQIVESYEYTPGLNYKKIAAENIATKGKKWSEIGKESFTLSANTHLEQGKRIEQFLPDLQPSFRMQYATDEDDKDIARVLLPTTYKKHYIGIYGSAYSNARNWNMWGPDQWFKLAQMLYDRNHDIVFVIIGAQYDTDLADILMGKLKEAKIPYVNTIGQPLSVVVEVLKRLTYFMGFPSGLSILNETLGKDTLMFYPPHLLPMMNAWAHPDRIKNGAYKACQLCPTEAIYTWLRNDYRLFHKLNGAQ